MIRVSTRLFINLPGYKKLQCLFGHFFAKWHGQSFLEKSRRNLTFFGSLLGIVFGIARKTTLRALYQKKGERIFAQVMREKV
jgi:hypothetical protein